MANNIKIEMDKFSQIVNSLGFGARNRIQVFVDNEIRRGMDKYVPFREGFLKNSAAKSIAGSGRIVYDVPYAHQQYYHGRQAQGQERGRRWAERYEATEINALTKRVQNYMESLS